MVKARSARSTSGIRRERIARCVYRSRFISQGLNKTVGKPGLVSGGRSRRTLKITLDLSIPEPWEEETGHGPKPMAYGEELKKTRFYYQHLSKSKTHIYREPCELSIAFNADLASIVPWETKRVYVYSEHFVCELRATMDSFKTTPIFNLSGATRPDRDWLERLLGSQNRVRRQRLQRWACEPFCRH